MFRAFPTPCAASWWAGAAAALLMHAVPAGAATIYRWVDDQGRTHVSDTVPEKYRNSATRIDASQYELSPAARREAEDRAARQKSQTDAASAPRRATARASAPATPAATPRKRPAQTVTETTDCATWRRLYRESQECFAPYRTATGGMKAEAFEHCTPIPSPDPKCGPLRE